MRRIRGKIAPASLKQAKEKAADERIARVSGAKLPRPH